MIRLEEEERERLDFLNSQALGRQLDLEEGVCHRTSPVPYSR
jgi:hypothetical protein